MGNGAKIYIVDTGTKVSHSEFGGRVQRIFGGDDDHSHGTHCAGTAAGATYGIARQSTIYSVKVCNQYGQCPVSTLLNGGCRSIFVATLTNWLIKALEGHLFVKHNVFTLGSNFIELPSTNICLA